MSKCVLLALVLALTSCSLPEPEADANQDSQPEALVAMPQREGLTVAEQQTMSTLLEACPGLTKYQADWALGKINAPDRSGQVSLTWLVSDRPQSVPAEYHAMGQRCFANVGGERVDRVGVIKQPCVQMCRDDPGEVPRSTEIVVQ